MIAHESKPSSEEEAAKAHAAALQDATLVPVAEAEPPRAEDVKVEFDRTEAYLRGPTAFTA